MRIVFVENVNFLCKSLQTLAKIKCSIVGVITKKSSSFKSDDSDISDICSSEVGSLPFPRSGDSICALARFRGVVTGVPYAEAFQLLKWIKK